MTFPKTTMAAILVELRKPLVVSEVQIPDACGVGQVLVRLQYSGICGSQFGEIDGVKGKDNYLPHLLGHEGSGHVVAVGAGVNHVKAGDAVVLHWRKGLGIEGAPPIYQWRGERLNAGFVTTFNQFAVVSENRLTPVPTETDLRLAALFGCAVTTGFGVVVNNAKVKIGESIVVYGSGGIGLNVVQAASLVSAYPIIAVDLVDSRLALAAKMGATHCIKAASVAVAGEEIKRIVGSRGLDVFIDNTGQPSVIELGYGITKPQGRTVLVGVPRSENDIKIHSLPLHFGKTLVGSFGGEAVPQEDIPRYLQLLNAGKIDLEPLITLVDSLQNINSLIERARSGENAGRCLIDLR